MRKFSKKQYLAAGAAAAIVVAGGGAAFAYWTSTGSGSSTASTDSDTHYGVAVTPADGNAALAPGGPTDHYTFVVTNNGSGNQRVSSATVTVANSDGTAWTAVAGCSAADFSVSNVSITPADLSPTGTTSGSFDVQMIDRVDGSNVPQNQDACKSVTVPLYVSVS